MKRSSHSIRLAGLALLAALSACKDGGLPTSGVALVASPSLVQITEEKPTDKVFLSTTPAGKLDWQITTKPSWVTVTPSSGTIRGKPVEVTVSADFSKTEPGTYTGKLELISSGGAASINVQGVVAPNPIATLSPAALSIPDGMDSATVALTNSGKGTLTWQVSAAHAWASVSPTSGFLPTGGATTIRVKVDRSTLPAGTASTTLTVKSNAKTGDVTLPIQVAIAPDPVPVLSRSQLKYLSGVTQQRFTLSNRGKGPLNWSLAPAQSWITVSPSSGVVPAGDSVVVTATVNRAGLPAETTGSLVLRTDAKTNGTLTIPVTVSSASAGAGFRNLNHRVVDAEYNTSTDLLVTVSANPSQLHILDPDLGTTHSVSLAKTPSSVSIRPDGAYAAVGHDGLVSLVNLATRSVERTYAVTTDAIDIVLASNGYAYVFPRTDQWEEIHSLNLATGVETLSATASIYAGTLAKLHPSGEYIYGADNGISPSDFEKYDIRSGPARVMYDSPYHGDYAFSGDLWFSEDGARIFARSGNVFRASTVRAEDMTYAGRLTGAGILKSAADSRRAARIVVLGLGSGFPSTPATDLKVFESQFLAYRGAVALPKFTVPGSSTQYTAEGQFVFFNSEGTRVYVLVRAPSSSGLQQDWGLATILSSSLP
ncbi:MAG TPA: hypothetical protein VHG28_11280 [Longimicrobiaceae bacterium]|nr:hypothetical protein [Longimicrobiaceae bacterium]